MTLEKSVGREEDKNGSRVVSYYTNVIAGDKGDTSVNTASRSPVVLFMLLTTRIFTTVPYERALS